MRTSIKKIADGIEEILASEQWGIILKSTTGRMRLGETSSYELTEELAHGDLSFTFNYVLEEDGLLLSTYTGKITPDQSNQHDRDDENKPIMERTFNAAGRYLFSFREAINLLEGRSVLKSYVTMDGVEKNGWFKAENNAKSKALQFFFSGGQAILPTYDLESILQKLPMGVENMEQREELIKSLKSGDQLEIRLNNKAEETVCFIQAEPASKSVIIFDGKKRPMTIQQLMVGGVVVNPRRNRSKGLSTGW